MEQHGAPHSRCEESTAPIMDTAGLTSSRPLQDTLLLLVLPFLPLYWFTLRLIGMEQSSQDMKFAETIRKAKDFRELCDAFGYTHEDHIVTTKDGYMLTLHRILPRDGSSSLASKGVVYMHHGLLTSSELFMSVSEPERCLPIALVENGYDVWLGNNRGNKYSQRHILHSSKSSKFWDFSIDDFARYDIPDSINFVLNVTGAEKLNYVGFSQGTAQAFAALSLHPELNDKCNVFVALAPIMRPPGFASRTLDGIIKYSPSIIYQVFGRKSMLSTVSMWQSILPSYILGKIIDISLVFLFDFHSRNITPSQKIAGYAHIYCYSSVKAVVHWSQIMRNSAFHMYDDKNVLSRVASTSGANLERFRTEDIKTPMVLIYGDQDSLVDMSVIDEQLPQGVTVKKLPGYEHLDILWGKDVHLDVIPNVLEALKIHAG